MSPYAPSSIASRIHPQVVAVGITVLAALLAGPAGATLSPREVLIVGQIDADQPWTTAPTEARLDQAPRLAVVLVAREAIGRRTRTVMSSTTR